MRIACTLNYVKDAVTINTTFNATNDRFKLEVCNVSEKAAEALAKEHGIKVKQDDKKGRNFNCKSKYPFKFLDDAGNVLDPNTVGNGSKAVVNITGSYGHKFEKMYGKSAIAVSEVVVTELVSYTPSENAGGHEEEAL